MKYWYSVHSIDKLDSPSLLVYPQRVADNIRSMVAMVDDVSRLRPHIKTHKTAEGIRMMMAAGIRKFKCATIAEAELLGLCDAPDVVLAYQPQGPKVDRFINVIKPLYRNTCLTDNQDAARKLQMLLRKFNSPVYT
jgi:D-serine deaminase-like pyridoxal phosphate-dependent protein